MHTGNDTTHTVIMQRYTDTLHVPHLPPCVGRVSLGFVGGVMAKWRQPRQSVFRHWLLRVRTLTDRLRCVVCSAAAPCAGSPRVPLFLSFLSSTMHHSRSEATLGSGSKAHAGVRLTPVHGRPASSHGQPSWDHEEKQQPCPSVGLRTRLVSAEGRPKHMDDPYAAASSASLASSPSSASLFSGPRVVARVDASGLPALSILSSSGLKGTHGEMSTLLRDKVARTAANSHTPEQRARLTSAKDGQRAAARSQKRNAAAAAAAAASAAQHPSHNPSPSHASAANASAPRVITDFSSDGGMGGALRLGQMAMAPEDAGSQAHGVGAGVSVAASQGIHNAASAAAAAASPSNAAFSATLPGQPSLHGPLAPLAQLASSAAISDAALQSQLRGLDLLSGAFGQLISEVGGSKGQLARLLTRVRDSYRLLFANLIDTLQHLQAQYHSSLHGCVSEYKSLQMRMDGKVAHLEQRVRLLTRISLSKDSMLALGEEHQQSLEAEVAELKDSLISGVKSATFKVEQSASAAIAESEKTSEAILKAARERARKVHSSAEVHGDPELLNAGSGSSFAHSNPTDALTQLSLESRNLTYELAELIQNVELQSEKSAHALGSLDRLLEQGARDLQPIHADAALNVAVAGAGASLHPSNSPHHTTMVLQMTGTALTSPATMSMAGVPPSPKLGALVPPSPKFGALSPLRERGVEHVHMAMESSPSGSGGATPRTTMSSPVVGPSPTPFGLFPDPAQPLSGTLLGGGLTPLPRSTPPGLSRAGSLSAAGMSGLSLLHSGTATGGGRSPAPSSSPAPVAAPAAGPTAHHYLSHRPNSAELRLSSRWQYLRHMTEEAVVESKWTSGTQTEESISGYCTVLHLEPVSRLEQAAAARAEAKLKLQYVSSVPTVPDEVVRDEAERTTAAAEEAARAAAAAAITAEASGRPTSSMETQTGPSTLAPTAVPSSPLSAATSSPSVQFALPPPPPHPVPLRPTPLRLNGFILPATLREFLAPMFGLLDSQGLLREEHWSDAAPVSDSGFNLDAETARSSGRQRPHMSRVSTLGINTSPARSSSHESRDQHSASVTGQSSSATSFTHHGTSIGAGGGGGGRIGRSHRRSVSDMIQIGVTTVHRTPPLTPRSASVAPGTPSKGNGAASSGPSHAAVYRSRRGSLSGDQWGTSLPSTPATDAQTQQPHRHSPRVVQPRARRPSLGAAAASSENTPRFGSPDYADSRNDTLATLSLPSGGAPVVLSPSSSANAPSSRSSGRTTGGNTGSFSPSGPMASNRSGSNFTFREPLTADELNPARYADDSRFAIKSNRDLQLAPSTLAQFWPPLPVQSVFESIFALYARYCASHSFNAASASVSSLPLAAQLGSTGASGGNGLCDLLIEYSLDQAGSQSSAPLYLGSLLASLMGLYPRSEFVRHFLHFVGVVHANTSGVDGADFTSLEGLDIYVRTIGYLRSARSIHRDLQQNGLFDYLGETTPATPADAFPPLSYLSLRTADLFSAEVLTSLAIKLPHIHDMVLKLQSWLKSNQRPPHSKMPLNRSTQNHVGSAAFMMRVSREWRAHVRAVILLAAKKTTPPLKELRGGGGASGNSGGGGGGDLSMDQWRQFLRGINAPVTDSLTHSKPHVLSAMLRQFLAWNRPNAAGEWNHVYAGLIPILRAAGFLDINIGQTLTCT